ncbi:MAG: non-hydrolyzing UDP-N-acetylglucosamine 2-epimerase [Kiloniellaceae bacterium]
MIDRLSAGGGVMIVAGTRPEMIKIAPIVRELASRGELPVTVVSTAQQADLIPAFLPLIGMTVDCRLNVMSPGQSLNNLLAKAITALDPVIERGAPDLVVVQGDTISALAGALAASMRGIPVAHIEAGLRTGDRGNPFPEENNRRLIAQVTALHCAPTRGNRDALLAEGIAERCIAVTGNPIVASLHDTLRQCRPGPEVCDLLARLEGLKPVVLTTHRRESLGPVLTRNLRAVRTFVQAHRDVALIAPVHLNPNVKQTIEAELAGVERVHLIAPLDYPSFLHLLRSAWLVVSDSGGVQEEVASLGKPLLILRSKTERPEVVACGVAKMAGEWPGQFAELLGDRPALESWIATVAATRSPFGDEQSPARIADAITAFLALPARRASLAP